MSRAFFRRTLVAAGGAVVVASVARADAPGQETSDPQYGKFDDSYVYIFDNHTHLSWQRAASSQGTPQMGAFQYCQMLSLGTLTSGWRVPSYKELLTIVDESPHKEYDLTTGARVWKAIDPGAFGFDLVRGEQTPTNASYWSSSLVDPSLVGSSLCISAATCAYVVEFTTGSTGTLPIGEPGLIRCVHD
jgi:hypothetical protein